MHIFKELGKQWEEIFCKKTDRDFTYVEEIKHFVSCIENHNSPLISGEDSLSALHIIEAAKKSHGSDQIVYIA